MKVSLFQKQGSILRLKIGTIVLACFLWFYVTLNETYSNEIECRVVPVNIQEGRTLASQLPETITLNVSGRGVDLMWLNLFWKSDLTFNVDFQTISSHFDLTLENYLSWVSVPRGFENTITVNSILYPDNIVVDLDYLDSLKVLVSGINVSVSVSDGFYQVGDVMFQPDSISLTGPRRVLRELYDIPTAVKVFEDKSNDFSESVDLQLLDNKLVSYSHNSVIVSTDIQKIGEKVINNIPIAITRNPSTYAIEIKPSTLSIRITGGVDYIKDLTDKDFIPTVVFGRSWIRGGEYFAPVTLELPDEILDFEITPSNITVEIK